MSNKIDSNYSSSDFFKASLAGAARGMLGFPIEQPMDRVKTYWQAHPEIRSLRKVIFEIYQKEKFIGFFDGGIPNSIRLASKQVYRFPIIITLPPIFEKNLPQNIKKKYPLFPTFLTGSSLAIVETFVVTPLERAKVWYMTSEKSVNDSKLFAQNRFFIKSLYVGTTPTFMKVYSSWISFLVTNEYFKNLLKKNNHKNTLSFKDLILVSIPVGVVNTLAVMPWDVAKTNMQKNRELDQKKRLFSVLTSLVKENGPRILFRGWQIKLSHSMIQAIVTVPMLDWAQRKIEKL
jgi:hypothetical protein